ncbi:MAG: 4'-phosphopantetheinyl transferase superfamily protein [Pseudohongiellaceae bacterium]
MNPGENSVHLWLADMADFTRPEMLGKCRSLLCETELERAKRFVFERHTNRLLITRGILRSLLSSYAEGIKPADWRFQFNEYGRPAIASPELDIPLYFNLSHSGQHLAVVVSRRPLTGVDVEQFSHRRRLLDIAGRFFSVQECRELEALAGALQLERFYSLWTLKEAYIKACGQGLAIPLREFSFSFPVKNRIAVQFDARRADSSGNWRFWLYRLNEASLAVAVSVPAAGRLIEVVSGKITNLDKHVPLKLQLVARKSI